MGKRNQGAGCPRRQKIVGLEDRRGAFRRSIIHVAGSRVSPGAGTRIWQREVLLTLTRCSFSAMSSRVPVNSASTDDSQSHTFGSDFSPGLHLFLAATVRAERHPATVGRAWSVVSDTPRSCVPSASHSALSDSVLSFLFLVVLGLCCGVVGFL